MTEETKEFIIIELVGVAAILVASFILWYFLWVMES